MRQDKLFAAIELAAGLGMIVGFIALLLIPTVVQLVVELPWLLRSPWAPPGFGLNPHWLAEVQYAPSFLVLGACAVLAACYVWLTSRRRGR